MVTRRKVVASPSWSGVSRPSTPRRQSADGRDAGRNRIFPACSGLRSANFAAKTGIVPIFAGAVAEWRPEVAQPGFRFRGPGARATAHLHHRADTRFGASRHRGAGLLCHRTHEQPRTTSKDRPHLVAVCRPRLQAAVAEAEAADRGDAFEVRLAGTGTEYFMVQGARHGRPGERNGSVGKIVYDQSRLRRSNHCLWEFRSAGQPIDHRPERSNLRSVLGADAGRRALENPSMPVPMDLVTTSASGFDPDISLAAALFQAPRIANARNLPEATVR
jgi:K+-transporting ATPase, c chain